MCLLHDPGPLGPVHMTAMSTLQPASDMSNSDM
jgi:hypothetical protein